MLEPTESTGIPIIDQWIAAKLEAERRREFIEGWKEGWKEGWAVGWNEGLQLGLVKALRIILQNKCSQVSARAMTQVQALTVPELNELLQAALKFETAKDLNAWLKEARASENALTKRKS